ncbi:hypothetical protein TIFTF001_039304 [Ficus carica]|uniref:Retrotransposon gag domain-containing protein n=1 Tax=Ficus carica TaxID=3494 RepID=A0AA88E9K4_FICCA|nr:hypothetical protein TIFTF001_039304 [Ficus carica]
MDPVRVEEDREAVTSFYESFPLVFDSTRRTVSLAAWLYDMELIFRTSHIQAPLQVSLASRCLRADARLWWMTLGEQAMPERTWGHFRTLVIDWHAYPAESMGHYCRRFQEAMLPHIPQDMPSPGLQALVILRNGLPPSIRQYVPAPTLDMTVGHMIEYIVDAEIVDHAVQADAHVVEPGAPADDIDEPEPVYEPGPVYPDDLMAADHVQEAEIEAEASDDEMDVPEDEPEDPPIIVISSDDEDDDEEPEHEPGSGGWLDEGDDFEEDPEEILDGDGDADSDAASEVTVVEID